MSATYTRAIEPASGEPITSRHAISAARAFGDRMKLGPSLPWRLVFYFLSAFKQIRNPDASRFLFPSQGEFFEFYQQLDPHNGQWPIAGPGEPEGTNTASQMGSFVFGTDAGDVANEADRLTEGEFFIEAADQKPETLWKLAKFQRGAIDPTTGDAGAPAINAANSQEYLRQRATSQHGNAYGDYLPGPQIIYDGGHSTGHCDAPYEDRPSLELIFTKLGDTPSTLTFYTCTEISGSAMGVYYTPFSYIIFKWDGTIVVLPKSQWIEGPYNSNPALRKTANGFIDRALNKAISDFRGTPTQRENGTWLADAFDTQAVLTTQYHLAPQKGVVSADGSEVYAVYPLFKVSPAAGTLAAGTVLNVTTGGPGPSYPIADGYVCASAFAKASGLTSETTVTIARDGVTLGTLTLTPESDGTAAALVTFSRPKSGGTITAKLGTSATFAGSTRELSVEITELMEYKPGLQDLYLILRCGGVKFDTDLDGTGEQCEFATEISTKYLQKGVITSIENHTALPGSDAAINSNAIFDAARRLSSCVRIMPRAQFTGIAVIGGKTILWFNRYARGAGVDADIDLFKGLAPAAAAIESGKLVWGKRYKVKTGSIVYNDHPYAAGVTFTALKGFTTFEGGGTVMEADGVYDALPGGFSNKWLMGLALKPYNPKGSSTWKPEAFADYFTLLNRCLYGDPAVGTDVTGVLMHVAYGQQSGGEVIFPESPDALNYVPTIDVLGSPGRANDGASRNFYESCGLFEPWPEAEKIELDGNEIKVTFATFHHDTTYDRADFARDATTWNLTDLRAEPKRTWRNGLREYWVYQTTGWNASIKVGDEAFNSTLQLDPDAAYGAVFPTFLWTQLPPEPYEDGNTTQDAEDAPFLHDLYQQLELYLRAFCEAFTDGKLTAANACAYGTTDLYGYTWENLMYRVTNGRGMPVAATVATDLIPEADTRPDQPEFHGPLPNTIASAEVAANLARAVNLLTTFRVMIPATLQCRVGVAAGNEYQTTEVNALGQSVNGGAPASLGGLGSFAVYVNGGPAGVGATSYTSGTPAHDWEDTVDGYTAALNAQWLIAFQTSPLGVRNLSQQMQADFRWVGLGDAIYALPVGLRELLTDSPTVFAHVTKENTNVGLSVVAGDRNGTQSHTAGHPADDVWSLGDPSGAGRAVLFLTTHSGAEDTCVQITGGTIATGAAPSGIAWDSDDAYGVGTTHRDGPQRDIGITLLNATTPAITVPLVDLA